MYHNTLFCNPAWKTNLIMDKTKLSVLSISALNIMTNASIAPVLVYFDQAFPEVPLTNIRLMLTLPALFIILSSLITGSIANKMPKRSLLFIGLLLYLIGGIGAGFCHTFTAILGFRIILGFGAGVTNTFSTVLISSFYTGDERMRMVGNATLVSHLVAVLAPLLAGWLAKFAWRYAFGIYGIALIVWIITFFWLPEPQSGNHGIIKNKEVMQGMNMVYIIAFNASLFMVSFYIFPTGIAHLINAREFGESQIAGLAASFSTLAAALINIIFTHVMKFFKKYVWSFAISLLAGGFYLTACTPNTLLLFTGIFVSGIGTGILFPAIMLRTTQYAPQNDASRSVSLVVAGSNLGQFLSPLFYSLLQRANTEMIPIYFDFRSATFLYVIALFISLLLLKFPLVRVQPLPTIEINT